MSVDEQLVKRLEGVAFQLAKLGGDEKSDDSSVTVTEWNQYYDGAVVPLIKAANAFPETKYIATGLEKAFKHEGLLIEASTQCKKPSPEALMKFVDPIVQVIQDAEKKCDNRSPFYPQQMAFHETIQVLSWVMVDGPKPFVLGQLQAADFHLMKILTKAKAAAGDEQTHLREFVAGVKKVVNDLANYIQKFYIAGITWNPKGVDIKDFKAGGAVAKQAGSVADRLEAAVKQIEGATAALVKKAGGAGEASNEIVDEWNAYYKSAVQPFVDACNLFPETKYIAEMTEKAWGHTGVVIRAGTECKKPKDDQLVKFVDPIVKVMEAAEKKCDNRSLWFPQQKAFHEVVQSLSFIMMDLPKPFIEGQLQAADFHLMKILKRAKDASGDEQKNLRQFEKTIKPVVSGLAEYVGKWHKTGLSWNPKGKDLADFKA